MTAVIEVQRQPWHGWWIAAIASTGAILAAAVVADLLQHAGLHSLAACVQTAGLLVFSLGLRAAWDRTRDLRPSVRAGAVRACLAASVVGVAVLY